MVESYDLVDRTPRRIADCCHEFSRKLAASRVEDIFRWVFSWENVPSVIVVLDERILRSHGGLEWELKKKLCVRQRGLIAGRGRSFGTFKKVLSMTERGERDAGLELLRSTVWRMRFGLSKSIKRARITKTPLDVQRKRGDRALPCCRQCGEKGLMI